MKEITNVKDLMETLEESQYNYYGLRNLTERDINAINSGAEYLDKSFVWEDNCITGETLDGTSAIGINEYMDESEISNRYLKTIKNYVGNTIALIADNTQEYGEDDGEVILGSNGYGAYVVAIVKITK